MAAESGSSACGNLILITNLVLHARGKGYLNSSLYPYLCLKLFCEFSALDCRYPACPAVNNNAVFNGCVVASDRDISVLNIEAKTEGSRMPRPIWNSCGSYPKMPRCPGPLPGVMPKATGTCRPQADSSQARRDSACSRVQFCPAVHLNRPNRQEQQRLSRIVLLYQRFYKSLHNKVSLMQKGLFFSINA